PRKWPIQVARIESAGRPVTPEDVWNAATRAGVDPARLALSLSHVLGEVTYEAMKAGAEDEPALVRYTLATGEVIEYDAGFPIPRRQTRKCVGELLDRYIFRWPRPGYPAAVVLGYGSIYNHSPDPNARFVPRLGTDALVFRAARLIEPGEQIFVDYEWPARDY